jgi:hypothetical protein
MIETSQRRQDQPPSAGDPIGELQILAERVSIEAFVEGEPFEDLSPEAHVAASKELDVRFDIG